MTVIPYTPNVDPRLAGGRLTIDLDALVSNWLFLQGKSLPGRAAAVVKANAYGLGIEQVVPALHEAGCRQFFVALPEEGLRIRALGLDCDIYTLNGLFSEACPVFEENRLTPVLGSIEEIDLWRDYARSRGATLTFAVHVDTGMNRLGLTLEQVETLVDLGDASTVTKGQGLNSNDGIGNAKPLEGIDEAE